MWLSGTFPAKGSVIRLNTTVDQLIAQKIGQGTPFPSIELATEDHSSHLGSCAGDFLCSYMSTISWRTPTQPLPMEINPRVVFERMFGGDAATPEERRARLERNNSILDAVGESVSDLQRGLGARDRAKLTEYLDNVREIERQIQQTEKRAATLVDVPPTPVGVPEVVGRAREADVRADGAGLSGEHHPRRVVHARARAQHAELSADRRRRRPSPGVAQQQRPRADGQEGQDRHVPPRPVRKLPRAVAFDARTATATCSIIRCSSTAAA